MAEEALDGEFKFLGVYALSIHKDKDRLEGREIMTAMMKADTEEGKASKEE